MTRIAFLGLKGLPSKGGAERVMEAVVRRLPPYGITPVVYCNREYTPADYQLPGVELVRLPVLPGKYFRPTSLFALSALHAVVRGDYDLVHLHNAEAGFVIPLLRARYPLIGTSHGAAYLRAKWPAAAKQVMAMMDYPFARWTNVSTSVSFTEAQRLSEAYHRQVWYIPNGVGLEYRPEVHRAYDHLQKVGLEPGSFFIFVAGRIEPTKGAHLAIQAVNELKGNVPLLIVGDDNQIPAYRAQIHGMAGPNVRFIDFVETPGIVFGLMKLSQGLIFPSTVEAMSMVLLEAASLGVPVICSDIPENQVVMKDQALYFASGSAASLREQLQAYLQCVGERHQIAETAYRRISDEFSWNSITQQYVQLYQNVLAGQAGRQASRSLEMAGKDDLPGRLS